MEDLTVFDKVGSIDVYLENLRDAMLGLDEPMGPYILNDNGDLDRNKIYKLTDTFMLYIMNGNPLYNKNELLFYRYCFLSMFFLAGSRECYDKNEPSIFKIILSFVDIMIGDMRIYAQLAAENYNSLKPTFVELKNATMSEDGIIILDEGEKEVKINKLGKKEAEMASKDWGIEHPNSLYADEILKINEKLLEFTKFRPEDFAEAIEYCLYAFLDGENKGYYSEGYLENITSLLFDELEKKERK